MVILSFPFFSSFPPKLGWIPRISVDPFCLHSFLYPKPVSVFLPHLDFFAFPQVFFSTLSNVRDLASIFFPCAG